ncbi:MAG: hypothetical protein QOG90_1970 [Actinomycetota bacterium]
MPNQLDDRIRSLVTSAVRTAPDAPHIDFRDAPSPVRRSVAKRATAIGAAIVAAIAGALVINQGTGGVVVGGNDTDTTAARVPAPSAESTIVTVGPNGVVERTGDDTRSVTSDPFTTALALDDGTFVAQRRSGPSISGRDSDTWPKSDTSVVRINASGHTTPLFDAVSGFVTLHDFAIVEGRRLLLYSVYDNDDPANPNEELYALDLDASTRPQDLGSVGGWEVGTSRLTLGSNGLIVGTSYGVCCSSGNFFAKAVPGAPAAARPLPKAEDFGLQNGYEDGCVCPTKFAVDPDGDAIYWLDPVDGGATMTVVRAALADPLQHTQVAPVARLDPASMHIASIDADDDQFVVSFGATQPPMLFTPDRSATLEGGLATLGPNG